jgi:hypothetical protein
VKTGKGKLPHLKSLIPHYDVMSNKKIFRNSPLYLLALLNLVYALQHGFTWLHYVTFALTAIVAVFDISSALTGNRE